MKCQRKNQLLLFTAFAEACLGFCRWVSVSAHKTRIELKRMGKQEEIQNNTALKAGRGSAKDACLSQSHRDRRKARQEENGVKHVGRQTEQETSCMLTKSLQNRGLYLSWV